MWGVSGYSSGLLCLGSILVPTCAACHCSLQNLGIRKDLGGLRDLVADQGREWSLGAGMVSNAYVDKRRTRMRIWVS